MTMPSFSFRRSVIAWLLLCSCFLSPPAAARAQTSSDGRWANGLSEPWWFSEEIMTAAKLAAQERWKSIGEETASRGKDEWSGDYFTGSETHGSYLRWSREKGFVLLDVNKCAATVDRLNYGGATASSSLVEFSPELKDEAKSTHVHGRKSRTPTKLIPVRWGRARFLIPEDEISDFGDYVAGLGKYNEGTGWDAYSMPFFIRMDDRSADEAESFPVVPPAYERYLKRPIEAVIISVGKRQLRKNYTYETDINSTWHDRAVVRVVTISAGAAQGVKRHMAFKVKGSEAGDKVMITGVGRDTATGLIIRSLVEGRETYYNIESEKQKPYPPVRSGWQLTTANY